jgi:hypothetical protein
MLEGKLHTMSYVIALLQKAKGLPKQALRPLYT